MFRSLAAPSRTASSVSPLEKQPQTTMTEDAPTSHPLQPGRKRRLSVYDSRVNWQTQSPFFKLPPEIRLMIYELVLGKNVIHVDQCYAVKTKYRHCVCSGDGPALAGFEHKCWAMLETRMSTDKFLGLPLICRMTYIETINVLYTCNKFDLRHTDKLAWLPARLAWLPTSRIHAVRSLTPGAVMEYPVRPQAFTIVPTTFKNQKTSRSRYWAETCRALEALKGLQDLRITVLLCKRETWMQEYPSRASGRIDEESVYWLLFPLKGVMLDPPERRTVNGRVLETTFRVVVNAEVGPGLRERLGPVPFQTERRDYPGPEQGISFSSYFS